MGALNAPTPVSVAPTETVVFAVEREWSDAQIRIAIEAEPKRGTA